MGAHETHNRLAPELVTRLISETDVVKEAMARVVGMNTPKADDPRRKYTPAQMEMAIRYAVQSAAGDTRPTAATGQDDVVGWQPIETARKDGTLVLLLVDYSDGDHWIDDEASGLGRTIGHNNDDNVGEGEGQGWQFAGWCWSHDHYVEGKGRPVKWMPLPEIGGDA